MPSTTIKLEDELVRKVRELKPNTQSISAFVRALIDQEHAKLRFRISAIAYEAFLKKNPAEFEAMELWEAAPLSDEIEPNKQ
jgi:predicted CopG family antitoxin